MYIAKYLTKIYVYLCSKIPHGKKKRAKRASKKRKRRKNKRKDVYKIVILRKDKGS